MIFISGDNLSVSRDDTQWNRKQDNIWPRKVNDKTLTVTKIFAVGLSHSFEWNVVVDLWGNRQ